MGEEINLRSTSPPLCDYQKEDISDYTPGPNLGDGPGSVPPVTYRIVGDHTSIDHISGLVPTTMTAAGYINGGPSINYRPRQEEPPEDRGVLGVGDVDVDTKCSDAYANLDDVRDRHYHDFTRGAARSVSPSERDIFRGVPNQHPKEQKRKYFFLTVFLAIVFIFQLFLLILGLFNLVNGLEVGSLTKSVISLPPSTQLSTQEMSVAFEQLRHHVDELRNNLTKYNNTHGINLDKLSSQILALNATLDNLVTDIENTTTEAPPPKSVAVPVYGNCTSKKYSCSSLLTVSSSNRAPDFAYCFTGTYVHRNSSTYLANIHCAVTDDNQLTPMSSTLIFKELAKEWSCRCQAILIPHRFFSDLDVFDCELHITECPKTLQIPLR